MSIPQNKKDLLQAIDTNFDKLMKELKKIPENTDNLPKMPGHSKATEMTVCDLVSYLVGWNALVLKWLSRDKNNEPIEFPEAGYKWNELGKLAEKFYSDYKKLPLNDLVKQLRSAKEQIIDEINARTNEQLYECTWYGKWTMGRMIQLNTAAPYNNARNRLRKWLTTI